MGKEFYQGRFTPRNPKKYIGNADDICFRSSYELEAMNRFDLNEAFTYWSSEEVKIPYIDPMKDGQKKYRTYYPDFLVKLGERTLLIEVKPKKDTIPPNTNPKKKTKAWVYKVSTWFTNNAKWRAAIEFCHRNGWEFYLMTKCPKSGWELRRLHMGDTSEYK